MKSCCKNMTPVTFQGFSNCNSRPYYNDEPSQLNMESIATIGSKARRKWLTTLSVADKEYVVIGRCRKSDKPLVGPGRFPLGGRQQLRPGVQLDESFPNGQDGGLSAIVDLKLMENIPHVVLDGLFAQVQVIGNFLVRLAVRDQA